MTKTKARTHAANIPSTPTGAGHDGLVASARNAPGTKGLIKLRVATTAIGNRHNAPRPCLTKLLAIGTGIRTATSLL
jgi:hypothetical protein